MQEERKKRKMRRAGVFGWLGLVVFAMLVLWPLLMIISVRIFLFTAQLDYPQLQDRHVWYYYKTNVLLLAVGCALLSMIGGILLFRRFQRSSVYMAIGLMWLADPGGYMLVLSLPALYGYEGVFGNFARYDTILLTTIGQRLLATVYLLTSRRVRRTYPKKGEPPPVITDN